MYESALNACCECGDEFTEHCRGCCPQERRDATTETGRPGDSDPPSPAEGARDGTYTLEHFDRLQAPARAAADGGDTDGAP